MSLIENIRKEMFESSKIGNTVKVDILKLVIAEIKNEEISLDKDLTDEEVIKVIRKQEKKIKDSISEYTKMQRDDLVAKETEQLQVIEQYLPKLLDDSEIEKVVARIIANTNAQGLQSIGLVMGSAMKELNGKADGGTVREVAQKLLSK